MSDNFSQVAVEALVQEYTQARLKDCMVKEDFANAMKSANKHIYMEILRENIMSELKLAESASIDDIKLAPLLAINKDYEPPMKYDVESKYNLNHLNNEQAIGYDNMEERAANLE